MSSFGPKRKARIIKVSDDDDQPTPKSSSEDGETLNAGKFARCNLESLTDGISRLTASRGKESTKPVFGSKGRKPFRQSGLRKTFNAGNDEEPKDDEDDGPAVVRPNISRNSSTQKKKASKSKLSFGGDTGEEGDGEESEAKPKKAPLGKRALENSAARRSTGVGGLPFRSAQDEDDRPKYSKEYLNELQSSTPNTPAPISVDAGDEMELDSSELEGAMVVDTPAMPPTQPQTKVLSEAEVREKKERRERLAKDQDYLALDDDDDDDDVRLTPKKKDDTRLKPEDEHMGEGFDDYVEDGGLSLGKRAEKERKRHDRKQMAELINAAEGHSSSESSDEDAERRMAYEAAQTRAGMDGLKKPRKDPTEELLKVPPKITPLPDLSECIQKLQASLKTMETEINGKNAKVQQLRSEKMEISKREAEVQALLDETGKKYQQAMGAGKVENGSVMSSVPGAELVGERGLESIGTTPRRAGEDDES